MANEGQESTAVGSCAAGDCGHAGLFADRDYSRVGVVGEGSEETLKAVEGGTLLSPCSYVQYLDIVTWGQSRPPYGRVYHAQMGYYLSGDTNPSYDYFLYDMQITSNPGWFVWNNYWATDKHRWKFQAYGTGTSIATASPSTTVSGGTISVSLGMDGAGIGWSYNLNDITCTLEDYRPSYVIWQHDYSVWGGCSYASSTVQPGLIQRVLQGANSSIYVVGTMYWHYLYELMFHSKSNCGNRVITFMHP